MTDPPMVIESLDVQQSAWLKAWMIAAATLLLVSAPLRADESDEQADLAEVSSAAEQSSETVNRMILTAHSETADTKDLQAFQEVGAEAVILLADIEDKSGAGAPLSETRAELERVAVLVARVRHLLARGKIELNDADMLELREHFDVLEQKYHPAPPSEDVEGWSSDTLAPAP